MSDKAFNEGNPFASLDKSRFPSAKGEKPVLRGSKGKPHRPVAPVAPKQAHAAEPDESELFLDAVRFIKPLASTSTSNKAEKDKVHGKPEVESTTFRDAVKVREAAPAPLPVRQPRGQPERPAKTAQGNPSKTVPASGTPDKTPDEDVSVFASAMRDVAPLDGKGRDLPPEAPALPPVLTPLPEDESVWTFAVNTNGSYVEGHLLGLDLMLVGKLQAGQFKPESHLDLHGLTAQEAFHTLVHFVRAAYTKDQRAVLIVSGRGHNSPAGHGVLREKLQEWLVQEPLRRVVLAFCTASPSDGGTGALYLLLRRFRKDRHPIYWERHPADPDLIWGTE